VLDGFIVFLRGESSVTESEAGGYIFSDEEKMTKLKIRSSSSRKQFRVATNEGRGKKRLTPSCSLPLD
jgi:hypothetical protein